MYNSNNRFYVHALSSIATLASQARQSPTMALLDGRFLSRRFFEGREAMTTNTHWIEPASPAFHLSFSAR
jgi:hypothetical protein